MSNMYGDEEGATEHKILPSNPEWRDALVPVYEYVDFTSSVIYLIGEITEHSIFDIITRTNALINVNGKGKEKPLTVTLFVNSPGGDVYSSLGIIDYMHSVKENVIFNGVCRGHAMSGAALILAACTGTRTLSEHSFMMFHEVSTELEGKFSDHKITTMHLQEIEEAMIGILIRSSNKDETFWKEKMSKDFYLSANEALKLEVIDTIV